MSLIDLVLRLVEAPLRFFLISAMLAGAFTLSTVQVVPQDGYPWPGSLQYRLPGLPYLVLGLLFAAGFHYLRVLAPIRSWGRLLAFLLTALAAAALLLALTPGSGLLQVAALATSALLAASAFWGTTRAQFLPRVCLLAFGLILLRFVALPDGGMAALWRLVGGSASAAPAAPSSASEFLAFLALLLFSGAIALQWPFEDDEGSSIWLLGSPLPAGPVLVSATGPDGAAAPRLGPPPEQRLLPPSAGESGE